MAEETDKKPGFVLNKKKAENTENKISANAQSSSSNSPEKKKIVVVKRKAPAQETAADSSETKKRPVPVVKKAPAPAPATTAAATGSATNAAPSTSAATAPSSPRPQQTRPAGQTRTTFEIGSARPNVKAGNLSTPNRQRNGGYNRGPNGGGYQNREGGYNSGYSSNRGGYGNGQRSGGFSGAQARENYQNRDRNGQGGGFNRQGGFNRGPNLGGGFNRQGGGFNRGPAQGGFNRGPNQGGRPGFGGGRPGFGGGRPGFGGAPVASAIPEQKGPAKKAFKGKKQVYNNRKDKEELFDEEELYKKKVSTPASVVPKSIDIMESVSISDLAKKMNLKASEIIGKLMSMGMMVTINQSIDSDTATLLAGEYGCDVHLVSASPDC